MNAVNSIAGGNVLLWVQVMNLPYEQFFLKQLIAKDEADYQKKYLSLLESQK